MGWGAWRGEGVSQGGGVQSVFLGLDVPAGEKRERVGGETWGGRG